MKKVAVTGSTGLVGSRVIELLKDRFDFIPISQSEMDITDSDSVNLRFESLSADLVLHLAAYTNVDGAEKEREHAKKVNVDGTAHVFSAAKQKNMQFIYISTDFVFDGQDAPFDEASKPNPIGYYGQTKYEAEQIVAENAMIVRITYPYRKSYDQRPDFMRSIKRLLAENRQIAGITDSIFTPTFIDDIALGLGYLMNSFSPEIVHLVGSESMSPHDAFVQIARAFGLNESLVSKTTYEEYFADKAKRPKNGRTVSKKNTFQKMSSFSEGLKKCL